MNCKSINSIEVELKNKIYYMQKALHDCTEIMNKLKQENDLLKEDCERILSQNYVQDLSKIRGD